MKRFCEWLRLHETAILILVTVALLGVTIELVVITENLRQWTVRSSLISDQAAADIKASSEALSRVAASVEAIDTHASSLFSELNSVNNLLEEQLADIEDDLEDTKDTLGEIKKDIADIKDDVYKIEGEVDYIEWLLEK
jgi:septal ring factor EnvC (AmiA/AmiB activator)